MIIIISLTWYKLTNSESNDFHISKIIVASFLIKEEFLSNLIVFPSLSEDVNILKRIVGLLKSLIILICYDYLTYIYFIFWRVCQNTLPSFIFLTKCL